MPSNDVPGGDARDAVEPQRFGLDSSVCERAFARRCTSKRIGHRADLLARAESYNTVCLLCHGVSIAPPPRGVVGRPIASVATFVGYSEGLKAKRAMSWTEANLDAFRPHRGLSRPAR